MHIVVEHVMNNFSRFLKVHTMIEQLDDEKCTWRLIGTLYKDRLETGVKGDHEEAMMVDMLVSVSQDLIYLGL